MTRSKRFRKRQTQRKTKRIIVGGGKTGNVSRAKKPRTARTARRFPNIEAVLRAAFHPGLIRRTVPPQPVNVEVLPRPRADPDLYLTPFVHNPFVPNPHVAPSTGVAPTSSIANTTRSAASYMPPYPVVAPGGWVNPAFNRRSAPPQPVNVEVLPRPRAEPALYLTPFVHNPFVQNPFVPNPPVAPVDSVVYRNHFEAPSARVAPTSSVANTTRSTASYMYPTLNRRATPPQSVNGLAGTDLTANSASYMLPYPVVAPGGWVNPALNRRSAPPPPVNVLAELTKNTADILAEFKSQAAPHASALPLPLPRAPPPSALPLPSLKLRRKKK